MRRAPYVPPCRSTFKRLGRQVAVAGGFEGRVLAALAHLREAWSGADGQNRPHVSHAIATLLKRVDHRGLADAVLSDGLEPEAAARLLAEVQL